jgi:aryl-alcohol dehydrogenase-like predicted oxidoreductase
MALGTFGLSGDGYGAVDEATATQVIERALELGVTLFDTCDAYGGGKMERLLGRLTKDKGVLVATRGGLDRSTDPPRKRFDKEWLFARIEASRKRLGKDAVDLYLLHNPSPDALAIGGAMDIMREAKQKGLVKHWGVSAGDVDVARLALEGSAEVVSLAYNLFNGRDLHRLAGDVMVSRAGVLVHSVLSYGLFGGECEWPKDREFGTGDSRVERWSRLELEKRIAQIDAVRYLVHDDVRTLRAAAVRFALSNHLVSSAILGPKSVEQLDQLVKETGAGPRYLPDNDLAELPRSLERVGIQL